MKTLSFCFHESLAKCQTQNKLAKFSAKVVEAYDYLYFSINDISFEIIPGPRQITFATFILSPAHLDRFRFVVSKGFYFCKKSYGASKYQALSTSQAYLNVVQTLIDQ